MAPGDGGAGWKSNTDGQAPLPLRHPPCRTSGTDSTNGLTPAEAADRLERFGPIRLAERKGRGTFLRSLLLLHNILIYKLAILLVIGFQLLCT